MMKLIWLKIRLLDLQQRLPVGSTSLGDGMRWQLEMMQLQSDIADYLLSRRGSSD